MPAPTPTPAHGATAVDTAAVTPTSTPAAKATGETASLLENAPEFEFSLYQGDDVLGGRILSLSDLQGKPLVLNFWAASIPPSRIEMPNMQGFYVEYGDSVNLLGLDVGPFATGDSHQDAINLLSQLNITYPAGYPLDENVMSKSKIIGLPTTFFITADGKTFKKWTGALNRDKLVEITEEMFTFSEATPTAAPAAGATPAPTVAPRPAPTLTPAPAAVPAPTPVPVEAVKTVPPAPTAIPVHTDGGNSVAILSASPAPPRTVPSGNPSVFEVSLFYVLNSADRAILQVYAEQFSGNDCSGDHHTNGATYAAVTRGEGESEATLQVTWLGEAGHGSFTFGVNFWTDENGNAVAPAISRHGTFQQYCYKFAPLAVAFTPTPTPDPAAVPAPTPAPTPVPVVVSLVGDKDGFGFGLTEGEQRPVSLGAFDNREADDPPFTDSLPAPSDFTFLHEYRLPSGASPVRATLRLFTLGVQDGDTQGVGSEQDMRLFIDGFEVTGAFDSVDQFSHDGSQFVETAGLVTVPIPEALLYLFAVGGGSDVRILILQVAESPSTGTDAIAIDYSELIIGITFAGAVATPAPTATPVP